MPYVDGQEKDIVGEYVEIKGKIKQDEEKMRALETLIFANHRDDPRIKIIAGRKSISITDEAYENLEAVGVETTVKTERRKSFDEFDISIQQSLLLRPENIVETISKESIRVVK